MSEVIRFGLVWLVIGAVVILAFGAWRGSSE